MSFFVEDTGGSFETTPTGVHLSRCYRIIDLGTQQTEYMGETKHQHKVMLGWEIHGVDDNGAPIKMKDGRPFAIFKNYTLSWSEKARLRLDLQAWRGKPFTTEELRRFDLKTVLGAFCMVSVVEVEGKDKKTYVNVGSVTPVPAIVKQHGMPNGVNPLEMFVMSEPDMAMFEKFTPNLKLKIQKSPEWQKIVNPEKKNNSAVPSNFEDMDDDVPFN